jgi:hypothetical protein
MGYSVVVASFSTLFIQMGSQAGHKSNDLTEAPAEI